MQIDARAKDQFLQILITKAIDILQMYISSSLMQSISIHMQVVNSNSIRANQCSHTLTATVPLATDSKVNTSDNNSNQDNTNDSNNDLILDHPSDHSSKHLATFRQITVSISQLYTNGLGDNRQTPSKAIIPSRHIQVHATIIDLHPDNLL